MSDPRNEPPRYGERLPGASVPPPASPAEPAPSSASYPEPPQQLLAPPRLPMGARISSAWVTYMLIAVCVVVFVAQYVTGINSGPVSSAIWFDGQEAVSQPWRFVTAMFAHANILHIASNMFALFIMGPQLERLLGHGRYAALYFISGFGGGVAVELLAPNTIAVGASGAIFGLFGAYFIIARRLGGSVIQIVGLIVVNLVISFTFPGIAWQAHLGGLVVGGVVALIYARPRSSRAPAGWTWMLVPLVIVLALIAVVAGIAQPS